MFFVTECLWLQGCKPSELIADVENIVRVYRGNLQPDDDSRTQNLGTTIVGSPELGQPAAEVAIVGRSGRSTVSVGKPRTSGRTAVGREVSRIV